MTKFQLMPLPFSPNDLEPYISARTIDFHYGRHHQGYVNKLNELLGTSAEYLNADLPHIIERSRAKQDRAIFNNAGQVWNHNFYWTSLCPPSQQKGYADLSPTSTEQLEKDFGSLQKMVEAFQAKAQSHFASGWVWLAYDQQEKKVTICETHDAETLATDRHFLPLIVCDVWEHAYYLDTQNNRTAYLEHFFKICHFKKLSERLDHHLHSDQTPKIAHR